MRNLKELNCKIGNMSTNTRLAKMPKSQLQKMINKKT